MVEIITPHITELGTGLATIAGLAVGASVVIVGIRKGFGLLVKMVKG